MPGNAIHLRHHRFRLAAVEEPHSCDGRSVYASYATATRLSPRAGRASSNLTTFSLDDGSGYTRSRRPSMYAVGFRPSVVLRAMALPMGDQALGIHPSS